MRRAFSLIEMAVVIGLVGIIAGYMLKVSTAKNTGNCYVETKAQLERVRDAIERYAMSNDRFPMPARRHVGVESPSYGREVLPANIADLNIVVNNQGTPADPTDDTTAVFGALPFQALGLPVEAAVDCWGNKLTYVVTKELTDKTKFLVPETNGAMDIKTSASNSNIFLKGAGYAIISHGADELGAAKANFHNPTATGLSLRKWCPSDSTLKTPNCSATTYGLISAPFNDGKSAGTNFFDDVIVARGKPWRKGTPDNNGKLYCWGNNTSGQMGQGTTSAEQLTPTEIPGIKFETVSVSQTHACATVAGDDVYCWGNNTSGQIGNGTAVGAVTTPYKLPTSYRYKQVIAGANFTCGLTAAGKAYCWGSNSNGQIGDGVDTGTNRTLPRAVNTAQIFTKISGLHQSVCGLTATGEVWCWGNNMSGNLGNGSVNNLRNVTPTKVVGNHTFADIAVGYNSACGITTSGEAWCWGNNRYGQIGNGDRGAVDEAYIEPAKVTGGIKFGAIAVSWESACALSTAGKTYCWGFVQGSPTATYVLFPTAFSGDPAMTKITANTNMSCGIAANGKAFCWGHGYYGGSPLAAYTTPRPMAADLNFASLSQSSLMACGIIGTPPPINGGWSDWGTCSATCGGGSQTRTCTTGSCIGSPTTTCNTQSCTAVCGGIPGRPGCAGGSRLESNVASFLNCVPSTAYTQKWICSTHLFPGGPGDVCCWQ